MQGDFKDRIECGEFEARLFDLLDDGMTAAEVAEFRRHAEACLNCGPLFEQVYAGKAWLQQLQPVEPPHNLVHNILARTSLADARHAHVATAGSSWWQRLTSALAPALGTIMQPRFAMTAAMSFFSFSMMLSVAGIRMHDLSHLDLRPSSISTQASLGYHELSARVVKYYDNVRFVYEFQSRLNELKKAAGSNNESSQPAQQQSQPQQHQAPPADDTSHKRTPSEPAHREENWNYVPAESEMASALATPAVTSVAAEQSFDRAQLELAGNEGLF